MGRPLVIICSGLIIIVSLIQMGALNRVNSLTQSNVETVENVDLKNHARAGLDQIIREYINSGSVNHSITPIGDGSITLEVTECPNSSVSACPDESEMNLDSEEEMILASATGYDGKEQNIHAIMAGAPPTPSMDAAIGIYDTTTVLDIRGNVSVTGYDQGDAGIDLPGITAIRDKDVVTDISGGAYTIEGEPEGFIQNENLDYEMLQEYYERYMDKGQVLGDDSSPGSYGTPENPKIMIMEGENKFRGGDPHMGGVIVVPPGSLLDLGGNFEFDGLIVNYGRLDIRGSVNISGGIMIGDDAHTEIDDDPDDDEDIMTGTVNIEYNSDVFEGIHDNLDAWDVPPEVRAISN